MSDPNRVFVSLRVHVIRALWPAATGVFSSRNSACGKYRCKSPDLPAPRQPVDFCSAADYIPTSGNEAEAGKWQNSTTSTIRDF